MGKAEKGLTPRETCFCQFYAELRNAREAAARAGYRLWPERAGRRLLERADIQRALERMGQVRPSGQGEVAAGYRRLSFGDIADAVRLLYLEEAELKDLEKMELFQIAEIKRPKGGGMEIKFFDRLRALEKLSEAERVSGEAATPFLTALEQGAQALRGQPEEDTQRA